MGKEVPEVLEAWTRGISIRLVDDPGLPRRPANVEELMLIGLPTAWTLAWR